LSQLIEEEACAALEAGDTDVYRRILTRVERPLLEVVLGQTDGNQIRAAALLGMNRNTLRKKIVDLGIRLPGRE
jgi:two-component system nitrogen regulation response regulator GlnG